LAKLTPKKKNQEIAKIVEKIFLRLGEEIKTLTKAFVSDVQEGHKLIERLAEQQPEIIERCEILAADKGYDDKKLINV